MSDGTNRLQVPQHIIDQVGRYGMARGPLFSLEAQHEWELLIDAIGRWGYEVEVAAIAKATGSTS